MPKGQFINTKCVLLCLRLYDHDRFNIVSRCFYMFKTNFEAIKHHLKAFESLMITRCHLGGFGRNLEEIIPTILPELPTQLRDLRTNKTCLRVYCFETITNKKTIHYIHTHIYMHISICMSICVYTYAQTSIPVALILVNLFSVFNFTQNGSLRF